MEFRKLINLFNEQGATPAAPSPSQQQIASGMAKQAQLVQSRNKPATNSMAARGKVDAMKGSQASDTQTSMTLGGPTGATKSGASPAASPTATPVTPPPAAGDQSGGSATGNKAFLPGAAGGAPTTPPAAAAPPVAADVAAGQNIGGKFAAAASQKAAQDSFAQLSGMAPTVQSQPTAATPAAPTPAAAPADNELAQNPSIVSPEVGKAQASSQAAAPEQPKGVFSNPTQAAAPAKTYGAGYNPAQVKYAVDEPASSAPTVSTGTGGTLTSGSGKAVTSRDFSKPQTDAMGRRINEVDLEEDDVSEEQIEEAFNDMLRLSGIRLDEKAVSKQQQKFMGMVHAMQKGEKVKGASKELKKAAKGMSKKDAKDFASTKHKGLPQRVSESVMLEAGNNLEHIVTRFKHETKRFLNGDELDDDLYNALYDYYVDNGEMPYGVAKAREGDPYQWVGNRFEDELATMGHQRQFQETIIPVVDNQLSELARLAGLSEDGPGSAMLNAPKKDTDSFMDKMKSAGKEIRRTIDRATLPAAMKVDYDRIEAEKDKEAEKKKNLDECGDMDMNQRDSMNVSTNMSSDGTKSVTISAQGEDAEALIQMLKLAGMSHMGHDAHSEEPMIMVSGDDEMMDEEYSNSPEEEYHSVNSITRQGNDLNREKDQYATGAKLGDNPMAEDLDVVGLDEELEALLNSVLIKNDVDEGSIRGGVWTSQPPEKGQPDVDIPVPMDPVYPNAKDINKPEAPRAPKGPSSPAIPRPGGKK